MSCDPASPETVEAAGSVPEGGRRDTVEPLLVILDLDETLVRSQDAPLDRPADFRLGSFHVYRRPCLDAFLDAVTARHRTAVWSSGSEEYVAGIVARIFPDPSALAFVWSRERCAVRRDPSGGPVRLTKDLAKVRRKGFSAARTLVVDDSPLYHTRNYGNLVAVPAFLGDPEDDLLPRLAAYLDRLDREEDVRRIEKRGWNRTEGTPESGRGDRAAGARDPRGDSGT